MWNQTTVCRACLSEGVQFFGVEDSLKELYLKLIDINQSSDISILSFCGSCTDILRSIQAFKNQCLTSNLKLNVKQELSQSEDLMLVSEIEVKAEIVELISLNHENLLGNNITAVEPVLKSKIQRKKTSEKKSHTNKKEKTECQRSVKRRKKKQMLVCDHCNESFKLKKDLLKHIKSHKKFSCSICYKIFQSFDALVAHRKSHEKHQKVVCHICSRVLARRSVLQSHIDRMHSELSIRCIDPSCKQLFGSEAVMQRHVKLIHDTKAQQWICDMCGDIRSSKSYLRSHIKQKHLKINPCSYKKCPFCSKMVKQGYYNEHVRFHTGQRLYKCTECPMEFITKAGLKKHGYSHAGNLRPFNCKLCDTGYYQTSYLKEHYRRTHGSEYLGFIKKDPYKDRVTNN